MTMNTEKLMREHKAAVATRTAAIIAAGIAPGRISLECEAQVASVVCIDGKPCFRIWQINGPSRDQLFEAELVDASDFPGIGSQSQQASDCQTLDQTIIDANS